MTKIEMVDLRGQYQKIKSEIDQAMIACVESAEFINGKLVSEAELMAQIAKKQ